MKLVLFFIILFANFAVYADDICTLKVSGSQSVKHDFGNIKLAEISGTYIWFHESQGNMVPDDVQGRNYSTFNYNTLYRVTDQQSHVWYFRFSGEWFDSSKTKRTAFYSVQWAHNKWPVDPGTYKIESVYAQRPQSGDFTMSTVGDSMTWFGRGQYLRCHLAKRLSNMRFIGSNTDSFGYGHDGHGGDGTLQVLLRINEVRPSDYYMLLIGSNDEEGFTAITIKNISAIVTELLEKKKGGKVILVSLPVRGDQYSNRPIRINSALKKWYSRCGCQQIVKFVDVNSIMLKSHDPLTAYIAADKIHPNDKGYDLISNVVSNAITKAINSDFENRR